MTFFRPFCIFWPRISTGSWQRRKLNYNPKPSYEKYRLGFDNRHCFILRLAPFCTAQCEWKRRRGFSPRVGVALSDQRGQSSGVCDRSGREGRGSHHYLNKTKKLLVSVVSNIHCQCCVNVSSPVSPVFGRPVSHTLRDMATPKKSRVNLSISKR